MNCFVSEEKIFDPKGNEIIPDEKGIVILEVDKQPRRFVKTKLIDWLTRNNKIVPPPKISVKPTPISQPRKKQDRPHKERPKKYVIRNVRKVRTDFTRKGIKIVAKKGNELFGPFISITTCAAAVKISKSQISKVLRGESTTTTQFEFIKITDHE